MNGSDGAREGFAPRGLWRSLAYRSLWYGAGLFRKAANALITAATGLLSRSDLKISSQDLWSTFCIETDQVDAGLESWEQRMYEHLLRPADRVLLVGCGTGRDLIALRALGHDVTGIDPAKGIAEQARAHLARRGMDARVLSGFIEDAALDDFYDVAVFSGCSYSYIQGSDIRVATLVRLGSRLTAGGRIAITYSRSDERRAWSHGLMQMSGRLFGADWRPEPGDTFERAYLSPGVLSYHHLFELGEVAHECAQAGLRVVCDEDSGSIPWVAVVRSDTTASHTSGKSDKRLG